MKKINANNPGVESRDGSLRSQEAGFSCKMKRIPTAHCCSILENVHEGIFTVDLDKKITYLNPAAETLTGFRFEETVGQYCFDVFRADLCDTRCPMDQIFAGKEISRDINAFVITKQGFKKPVHISVSALKDEKDHLLGGVEIFQDLTDIERLRKEITRRFTHEDIIATHPRMREILSALPDIAASDSPVIITGPTGSGKELIARAVHSLSKRKKGPFIAVNCAALPDTLLESELFGYARGAFTGAVQNKPGRFMLAHKGTLFLDEVCNTSLAFQADLLRVVESGEFMPLGETRTLKVDFRVVAATNMELKELVRNGKFREDLYYRLNVIRISLPSLTERKEDIPLLIDHFINKLNLVKGRSIQGISEQALRFLLQHDFPGNIRELENIIEYAFVVCKDPLIGVEHLPKDLRRTQDDGKRTLLSDAERREVEKIRAVLDRYPNNRNEAARVLEMSRTTLWRKMKQYGLIDG